MASPPGSPAGGVQQQRPMSAMIRPNRSSSRMSMSSRPGGGGSRASDEDGKTAVKVAVRVRPPLQPTDPGYELVPQRFRGSTCQVTSHTSLAVEAAQGKKLFVFDRVFGPEIDQEGIWEYLSESVNSFVQGYNVSILAYGQSGAGKSYTMGTTGPREQNDDRIMGVIPRAAAVLFEKLTGQNPHRMSGSGLRAPSRYSSMGIPPPQSSSKSSGDKSWQMKATYVEIYNEQLRDLLLPESVPQSERSAVSIREDPKGRILLTGLRQVTINSIDDLLNALNFGSAIRQTDATAVNAKSSRSHAVFSLNLVQKRSKSSPTSSREKRFSVPLEAMSGSEMWVTVDSKLHFVDLAGSERLKNTGAHGERAKEGISINAGLASLGKVISQLSSRSSGSHVSYRDSKLTRLLQDSLGGNAITYMVACVNPAEFHLSETLNTVQYAQRARAIQSKPQIQQVNDDGNKQALIERLRAEVQFLRDQIRLSERTERRGNGGAPSERSERQHEREVELQNQLLDIQENYNALSQRHAKLISEITKARGENEAQDGDTPMLKDAIGETALERLKRSNSFAEAVESVVLEYEKTIQSLEASLSNTRTSLSNTESSLLEKETKIAYMETVTQQLQARIQKSMDREASSEGYVRELEARVDGVMSGEERSSVIIQDLRKELSRVRENEASCEEYISTLEERLAEAEQDHELMQREIERLEHVVERQRSIGKLDNLLYELDHIRHPENGKDGTAAAEAQLPNGHSARSSRSGDPFRDTGSTGSPEPIPEDAEAEAEEEEDSKKRESSTNTANTTETAPASETVVPDDNSEGSGELISRPETPEKRGALEVDSEQARATPTETPQSPAQSKFVADKLENVTQELFDLRMEHENTVTEYDELARKYQIALNTLAELQDAVDEARHAPRHGSAASASSDAKGTPASSRPESFLAEEAAVNGHKEDGQRQHTSSRTLSSELSLVGESPDTAEQSEGTEAPAVQKQEAEEEPAAEDSARETSPAVRVDEKLAHEIEELRKLQLEKEANMKELKESYADLHEQHQNTLDYVEELKAEVQKAQQIARSASPTSTVIRRKSSQTIMTTDRANRSFASLRNIALENFEGQPDTIQNFELNLNAVMNELHVRSERCQTLEGELNAVRKEMESKMTIISGLTRERSSLKASSPLDISVVATMQDQLNASEQQMRNMHESHAARETELLAQIESLKASLAEQEEQQRAATAAAAAAEAAEQSKPLTNGVSGHASHAELAQLQSELEGVKAKHASVLESTQSKEKDLLDIIDQLKGSLREVEASRSVLIAEQEEAAENGSAAASLEQERSKHLAEIEALQGELEEHKAVSSATATKLEQLEQSYSNILRQVEEDTRQRELTEKELAAHRGLVANLEGQIEEHKAVMSSQKTNLEALREEHSQELEQATAEAARAQAEASEKLAAQIEEHKLATMALQEQLAQTQEEHQQATAALQDELTEAQNEMANLVRRVARALDEDSDVEVDQLQSQIESLVMTRKTLTEQHERAAAELRSAREELTSAKGTAAQLEGKVDELKTINEETLRELEKVSEKEKKSSRLVEELEEQLTSNYDQHQATSNRLSALQSERQSKLDEALAAKAEVARELDDARARIVGLEAQLAETKRDSLPKDSDLGRSNSTTSNLRKSASHTSLPSPPPAIPLPPLPSNAANTGAGGATGGQNVGNVSPNAASSPPQSRHQSKDIAQAQLVEDQEARIRTIEKHLFAEKQLTATLEEALTDLETSSTKVKTEMEGYKKKCAGLEDELAQMKKERNMQRYSLQAVEEERNARMRVEAERAQLEARMAMLNSSNKKKKKSTLNCF
ncbi:hypothetical protein BDY21DRAFT_383876 [Lineolata rhizophorae]|uniref:Kinesin motor domain-containing protein n=1 Tax=Lineolata rhizophorae TaxID=578093 RepID=A0A6A6PCI8_9PEZI|nr:hypothetical protein BDY21DRAFT_383876 [Lineolata rhizophorae]